MKSTSTRDNKVHEIFENTKIYMWYKSKGVSILVTQFWRTYINRNCHLVQDLIPSNFSEMSHHFLSLFPVDIHKRDKKSVIFRQVVKYNVKLQLKYALYGI